MDVLHTKVMRQFALVNLDKPVILFPTQHKYFDHGGKVLTLLHDACMTLNLKNC